MDAFKKKTRNYSHHATNKIKKKYFFSFVVIISRDKSISFWISFVVIFSSSLPNFSLSCTLKPVN